MATQAAVGIQLNEENLIRAGQRGDEQAVEALFRRYQRPLFQTALRVLGNTEDAEEIRMDEANTVEFGTIGRLNAHLSAVIVNQGIE